MTKKDYIAIGEMLARMKGADIFEHYDQFTINTIAARLCDIFRKDNPRFNAQRFIGFVNGACGPSGGKPPKEKR